jgi:hypothetical protein
MYQAGVKNITLYENVNITFNHYDPLNLRKITDLQSLGAIITIENMQRPEYDLTSKLSKSGLVVQDISAKFFLLGLTLENYDLINQLKLSIYGWCFMVEYYDGTFKFYNVPLFCEGSKISPHKEMSFELTMKTAVQTFQYHYEYTPSISLVPVYRWDSEVLTFDSEIYTFDYEL